MKYCPTETLTELNHVEKPRPSRAAWCVPLPLFGGQAWVHGPWSLELCAPGHTTFPAGSVCPQVKRPPPRYAPQKGNGSAREERCRLYVQTTQEQRGCQEVQGETEDEGPTAGRSAAGSDWWERTLAGSSPQAAVSQHVCKKR